MFEPLARVLYFFRELLQISLTFPVQFSKIELLCTRECLSILPPSNFSVNTFFKNFFLV